MHRKTVALSIRNLLFALCSLLLLNGCLVPEEDPAATGDGGNADAEILQDHELLGSVGDGPVVNAQVRVVAADGTNLGTVESDTSADFSIVVRTKGSYYPLVLDASSGTDLVTLATPDFRLRSTVLKPGKKTVANMNPFTTLAMELATDMAGGVSDANVTAAIDIVVDELGSGLDSIAATGPLETPIDGGNIAEMIKASEVLGEVLRRTRDALQATGRNVSADTVVGALGSDLGDRVIDGRGGARADARTAAVASVAAAQVMLEAMRNRLQVMGTDARPRMQDAITRVYAGAVSPTLDELPVTDEMLTSARIGLLAASALQPSATLEQALSELDGLRAGMTPAQVSAVLTTDTGTTLDNVVLAIASASAADLELVNSVARSGVLPETNQAPEISGQPQTSVDAGAAYSFTPSASDADGDPLTFSISGRPLWAAFDGATGTLSGTPQDSDAGSNTDIVITVSDGELSASLPAFTLTVVTVAGNTPPVISGTPPDSVVAGEEYRFMPSASDADGDTLSFSITGQPAWTSFDSNTGLLSGTPAAADVGTHGSIVITVDDGQASTSLAPFAITVEAAPIANTAPQISGTPPASVVTNS
ncbi:MAG TPA: putative Ig domain-containing protein [Woeseiaceae bacterium]|nr:putative Ig domain-containing protein [Woeseiaceae bacterium]